MSINGNGQRKKRVLVCDDEPRLLTFVELKLRLSGYEVIITTSGETALELARKANPDVMVLDIIMPGMGGLDVLRELRTFTRMPVIVFSARPGNSGQAMSLGANDYIAKPFDPDELVRRIRRLTEPGGGG